MADKQTSAGMNVETHQETYSKKCHVNLSELERTIKVLLKKRIKAEKQIKELDLLIAKLREG